MRRAKRVGRPVDAQDVRRHGAAQVAAGALGQQYDLRDQYGQPVLTISLRRAGVMSETKATKTVTPSTPMSMHPRRVCV